MADEQPPAKKKRRKRTGKVVSAELAIEKRREQVTKLRLSGWTTREIAAHLNCSIGTVSSDEKAVFDRTRAKTDATAQREKTVSLARLDQITKGVWPDAITGDIDAGALVLKIEKRRAEIHGFDAPVRREHSGPGGQPVSLEHAGPGGQPIEFDAQPRRTLATKLGDIRSRLEPAQSGGTTGEEPGGGATAPLEPH